MIKMDEFESIAKAFPDTKKPIPWFPDRSIPLFIETIYDDAGLISFCNDMYYYISKNVEILRSNIETNIVSLKKGIKVFHGTFSTTVVMIWMIDKILDGLEERNSPTKFVKDLRKNLKERLDEAIKFVVQGDYLWLGEHADWWVPKQRASHHKRNKQ